MATAPPPPPPPNNTTVYRFNIPQGASDADQKRTRDQELRRNPDCLYENTTKNNSEGSLIFFTTFKHSWISTIKDFYPETKIENATDEKQASRIILGHKGGTIRVFSSGKFLILENCDLRKFKEQFEDMKFAVMQRRVERMQITTDEGQGDEGQGDEGQGDEGQGDEGQGDEGQKDEGQKDEGQKDEGQKDEGQEDEGQEDEGQEDEGQGDEGQGDEGQGDEGQGGKGKEEEEGAGGVKNQE